MNAWYAFAIGGLTLVSVFAVQWIIRWRDARLKRERELWKAHVYRNDVELEVKRQETREKVRRAFEGKEKE